MTADPIAARLRVAVHAARRAGRSTLAHFQQSDLNVERKDDGTPVTIADREAERVLRAIIADAFPGDGVLGEEFGETPGDSGYRWVLDPIDGTKSFVRGVPAYGTLVACERADRPIVGVVYIPALDEIVYGGIGQGAWHALGEADPVPAHVSSTTRLRDACVCTTSLGYFHKIGRGRAFELLSKRTGLVRGWSDCYAHVLLATGRIDAVIEPYVHYWDVAHLPPILGELGGHFAAFDGKPDPRSSDCIATNGRLTGELLTLVRDAGREAPVAAE
ncbi:MAG: inositol monophosphatase family protein [Phycisphaeraceae bacterium]|nr:inositol monophosphatase family protein [Phycisphaeraceae bacterium]